MKLCSMLLMAAMCVLSVDVHAQYANTNILAEILSDVASTNQSLRLAATNKIDSVLSACSNADERATFMLLKAKLLLECVDVTDGPAVYSAGAYRESTNICLSVLNSFRNDPDNWRPYGAAALAVKALSIDSQHQLAFNISTNALSMVALQTNYNVDTNVWVSMFGQELLDRTSMTYAFKSVAAISLSLWDSSADIFSYTNDLPDSAVQTINRICGK